MERAQKHTFCLSMHLHMASESWSTVQLHHKWFPFNVNSVFTMVLKPIQKGLINGLREQQKKHGQTVFESISIKSITSQNILPFGQHTKLLLTTRKFNSLTAKSPLKIQCFLISTLGQLSPLSSSTSIYPLSISLSVICFSILMTKVEL